MYIPPYTTMVISKIQSLQFSHRNCRAGPRQGALFMTNMTLMSFEGTL